MSEQKKFIFVSSSSDLAGSRERLGQELQTWLSRQGLSNALAPYLWEQETDAGRMLVDRMPIQAQLPDAYDTYASVPFVICMFGERCGVPLQDDLANPDWEQRIESWRAGADGRGLVHPWPKDDEAAQDRHLDAGGFPLTGTVFELISACEADPEQDNLVIGYVANRHVDRHTTQNDVFFNQNVERKRLLDKARNPAEEKTIERENYSPQIRALINVLTYFGERYGTSPQLYATEEELVRDLAKRARQKLSKKLGLASNRNPFKTTLEHWTIDDENPLPGRTGQIKEVLVAVETRRTRRSPVFILIKGASGCGKSSLLHRGVLATLSEQGTVVLPLRPTDLESGVANEDQIDLLWARICDRLEGCPQRPPSRHKRDEWMAQSLINTLEARNTHLAIGLDQFEEILDELHMFRARKHRSKRWWLVLRFFGRLAGCHRVQLLGTLENTRWERFQELEIEQALRLNRVTIDADVTAKDAAHVAQAGFGSVGIMLESDVIEAIKSQWETFEGAQSKLGHRASPLPLACLRFARLFEEFEDMATVPVHPGDDMTSSEFGKASEGFILGLDRIGGERALAFDGLIQELANQAWNRVINEAIEGWPLKDDPGTCNVLSNLLDPLVGVDTDGHIRLLAVAPKGADANTDALRASFRQARLLVPAGRDSILGDDGSEPLIRLVHQAVIDQWKPAHLWFQWRKDYLITEDRMRLKAKVWNAENRKALRASARHIQHAAQVLHGNRVAWYVTHGGGIDCSEDRDTLDYVLMIFRQAQTPRTIIKGSIYQKTYSHLASGYHLVDLLQRFWGKDPSIVEVKSQNGRDLYRDAAWIDGPAIRWLLNKRVKPQKDEDNWHPIEAAIQTGAWSNYLDLISCFRDLSEPVGPNGSTMLGMAAFYGNCPVIEDLLTRKVNPDSPDADGRSALMWAARSGKPEGFRLLLPVADIEAVTTDRFRYSVLHFAAISGQADIIRTLLDSDVVDEGARDRLLVLRDGYQRSPLMLAVLLHEVEVLRLLLGVCDPRDPIHQGENERTLFHTAVSGFASDEDDKLRARRTIELLIDDDRLDPNLRDTNGNTAFELARGYPEARRRLRQQMTLSYPEMTGEMRLADLQSSNPADALKLLREAPVALTDRHQGKAGLDVLLEGKKYRVLSVALREGIVSDQLLIDNLERLVQMGTDKWAGELRSSLIGRISRVSAPVERLGVLLDSALRDEDHESSARLIEQGATTVLGGNRTGTSIFHELAIKDLPADFEELASRYRLALPIDKSGRRPSDLAADRQTAKFARLESRLFAQPKSKDRPGTGATSTVAQTFTSPLLVLEQQVFTLVEGKERDRVLKKVRSTDGVEHPNPRATVIRRYPLPFYENVILYELQNPKWPATGSRLCFLDHRGSFSLLNGTSPPIHAVNARAELAETGAITEANVLEYLAFFCFFVRGDEGPFLICDRLDNQFLPPDIDRQLVADVFRAPKVFGEDANKNFRVSALVYYSDYLFFADFAVHRSGMVEMLEDWPVAELGTRIEAPLRLDKQDI